MGRYKFDKFLIRFSKDTQIAIIKDLIECYGINDGDYDWNIIDIRVKKANRALRHRFADTIAKLEAFDKTEISGLYEILENGERDICVSAACFARITGRNRKTVVDWINKGFIATTGYSRGRGRINIMIRKTIKKLKQM